MSTITEKIISLTENNSVNIYYDTNLGQIYYEDWKLDLGDNLLLLGHGRNGPNYAVIGKLEKPYYTRSKLSSMKKLDLIDLAYYYDIPHINEDWTKSEIVNEIYSVVDNAYYYSIHHNETRWYDLESDFTITGYSQGDAIKVNIIDDEYKWNTKEYLENIFFDTPINGTIVFKGKEYYPDEYLESQYSFWDKTEFIDSFIAQYSGDDKVEFKEFLEYFLPEQLEYI